MTERQSWPRVVWAHLFPGVVAFFFYVVATRMATPRGLPRSFALFLSMLVVLIPYELGVLIRARKRAGGRPPSELIPYTRRPRLVHYIIIVPILLAWMFFCLFVIAPHEQRFLVETASSWAPRWLLGSAGSPSHSRGPLIATWVFGLAVNGLALPFVEELYFRGYLLPRIPCGRQWSPLVNSILFSLYHVFSPWQNLTRIAAVAPMVYVVSHERSVYIGMVTHCSLNTLAMLITLPALLR
jgi:CAAX protease family protein